MITLVGGAHTEDARQRGRVLQRRASLVPGSSDDEHAVQRRILRRRGDGHVVVEASEARVDHARAVVDRPEDPGGDPRVEAAAVAPEDLHGQDPALPAVARDSDFVVAGGADHTRDGSTVAVVVGDISVAVDEVVSVEQATLEVRLRRVDSRVEDSDDNRRQACCQVPRLRRMRRHRRPFLIPELVVGLHARVGTAVELCVANAWQRPDRRHDCGGPRARDPDDVGVDVRQ